MSKTWTAYILYPDDPLIHCEGLPGLTPCGLAFSDLFGAVLVSTGHKRNAPLCETCFPPASEAARVLGNLGKIKGGEARAKALSPERRKEIAVAAARARWDRN